MKIIPDLTLSGFLDVLKDKLRIKGTSTGKTIVTTSNTSASDNTITLPAVTGTLFPMAYGSMYEWNVNGTNLSLTSLGSYYGWVTATSVAGSLVTFTNDDVNGDGLTVSAGGDGVYLVMVDGTIGLGASSRNYHAQIYKNAGAVTDAFCYMRESSSSNRTRINIMSVVSLAANDVIRLKFNSANDSDTLNLYKICVTIVRIGV